MLSHKFKVKIGGSEPVEIAAAAVTNIGERAVQFADARGQVTHVYYDVQSVEKLPDPPDPEYPPAPPEKDLTENAPQIG